MTLRTALRQHWPEYAMEAAELGAFLIAAALVVAALEHPDSPARALLPDATVRRVLTGVAMGLTAVLIIYSPWGKQSGAHFNPAVTLTFWRLGKVAGCDALFYIVAQFIGAVVGVLIARALLGELIAHPSVNYVATVPGAAGVATAFLAEVGLAFGLMSVVLAASNAPRVAPYTGLFAGALVAVYISIEAPLSGMSINPARSFGPAAVGQLWMHQWIYFLAPPLGMLLAAGSFCSLWGTAAVDCAKLHHRNRWRCIFCGAAAVSGGG